MGLTSYIYKNNFEKYNIGFIDRGVKSMSGLSFDRDKIHWLDMKGYSSAWFADPFIVDYDDNIIRVLVEEYVYACQRGRISVLTIDRKTYSLIDCRPILEDSTHFSFPHIIYEGDKMYMCPENYQSGLLSIYELDKKSLEVTDKRMLIDMPLVDAQIAKIGTDYYVFGIVANNRGNLYDDTRTVSIYKASSLLGPYTLFQTIDNSMRIERGAGAVFQLESSWVRPVQKCEKSYGEAVLFLTLTFDGKTFKEKIIGSISPNGLRQWGFGLHTFNQLDDLIVVDGIDYNWHFFSLWFKPTVRLLRYVLSR